MTFEELKKECEKVLKDNKGNPVLALNVTGKLNSNKRIALWKGGPMSKIAKVNQDGTIIAVYEAKRLMNAIVAQENILAAKSAEAFVKDFTKMEGLKVSNEILFRGKRVDSGEWVKGYYYCDNRLVDEKLNSIPVHIIIQEIEEELRQHQVIVETVSQYSQINDIKDNKIFAGDKVKDPTSEKAAVVEYRDGAYMVGQLRLCAMLVGRYQLSVIGNIYEA